MAHKPKKPSGMLTCGNQLGAQAPSPSKGKDLEMDVMINQEPPTMNMSKLFRTPDNWDEIYAWINSHPPEDRSFLIVAAYMGYNLALNSKG